MKIRVGLFSALLCVAAFILFQSDAAGHGGARVRHWIVYDHEGCAQIFVYTHPAWSWPEMWINAEGAMQPQDIQPKYICPIRKGIRNVHYVLKSTFSDGYVEIHEFDYTYGAPSESPPPDFSAPPPPPPQSQPTTVPFEMPWGCAGFGQCPTPVGSAPRYSLSVEPDTIRAGECATLRWDTAYAQEAYIDNEWVPAYGSRSVCPGNTYTYYLKVMTYDGQTLYQSATLTVITPASSNARQIRFNIEGATFTRLKIMGENQYGVMTTWQAPPLASGYYYYWADTTGYWWQKTILLEFDIVGQGTSRCVVEYLHPTTAGDTTPVTYTPGAGCSGDEGNGGNWDGEVLTLYHALNYEDATGVYGLVMDANDRLGCLREITKGIQGVGRVIMVSVACGQVALNELNALLEKYNKYVEMGQVPGGGPPPLGPTQAGLDLDAYCRFWYGSNAYSSYTSSGDPWSWGCYRDNARLEPINMDAACRWEHPNLPRAFLQDQTTVFGWVCIR